MSRRPPKSPGNPAKTAPRDEQVGYRRPPKAHRFKPGQSGNPSGRPPAPKPLSRVLEEALEARTIIRVQGRARKVTKREAMTRKLTDMVVAGDARILRLLLDQIREAEARAAEEPATQEAFSAADREVIAALVMRIGQAK